MLVNAELTAPGSYPILTVQQSDAPNKFWAIPVVGIVAKGFALIPMIVWLYVLELAMVFMLVINSFAVLFSGTYMAATYNLVAGFMRLASRVSLFGVGITDSYPSFSLDQQATDRFTLDLPQATAPSRLYAIPMLGGLVRFVLLLPLMVWSQVIGTAVYVGLVVAAFAVLFTGRYPETIYEMSRDSLRLYLAQGSYLAGFTDAYPSFSISMNHSGAKWALIIIGALLTLGNFIGSLSSSSQSGQ